MGGLIVFRFKKSIPVGYDKQGYIYFKSLLYYELPEQEQKKILNCCLRSGGRHASNQSKHQLFHLFFLFGFIHFQVQRNIAAPSKRPDSSTDVLNCTTPQQKNARTFFEKFQVGE